MESGFPNPALLLSGRPRRMRLQSYLEDLLTHDVENPEEPATKRRDTERQRRYFEAYELNSDQPSRLARLRRRREGHAEKSSLRRSADVRAPCLRLALAAEYE